MSELVPRGEIILYQTEDGRTRIECRFEDESIWLTQRMMADLFQVGVNTVNYHIQEIIDEGEVRPEATIRKFRIVQLEGRREVSRLVEHYNLDAILAVGYRVRSARGSERIGTYMPEYTLAHELQAPLPIGNWTSNATVV